MMDDDGLGWFLLCCLVLCVVVGATISSCSYDGGYQQGLTDAGNIGLVPLEYDAQGTVVSW